jgi:amino acid transporter
LTLWPLVAATFFMVSGGAYGTEDIVHGAGYRMGILILLVTPLVWSLPVACMVGELAGALPDEGGYYVWVRRALGDFWGFQEAWLSFLSSIFDMAIYPVLFVAYLSRLVPWIADGPHGIIVGVIMIAVCAAVNIAGVRAVGVTSLWLLVILSAPFALLVALAPFKAGALGGITTAPSTSNVGLMGGVMVAMWNYQGWDCASTVAGEVDQPQRTYPRAMLVSVLLVAVSYVLPVAALSLTGLSPAAFETGSWADAAGHIGGVWLRLATVVGGTLSAFGLFNALVLSYSRLPVAMAEDGMLPSVLTRLHPRTGAPFVAIVVCATAWAGCLGLGFERLIIMDVTLCGLSLVLEFVALIVLRVREPQLPRPYRVPGGMAGAVLIGLPPTALVVVSMLHAHREQVFGINGLVLGILLILAGVAAFGLCRLASSPTILEQTAKGQ